MNNSENQLTDIPIDDNDNEMNNSENQLTDIPIDDNDDVINNSENQLTDIPINDDVINTDNGNDVDVDVENNDQKVKKTKETLKRTVIKALIWRIIAVISTIILAVLLYNDLKKATMLAIVDNLIKLFLHFFFELAFNKWKWGIIIE